MAFWHPRAFGGVKAPLPGQGNAHMQLWYPHRQGYQRDGARIGLYSKSERYAEHRPIGVIVLGSLVGLSLFFWACHFVDCVEYLRRAFACFFLGMIVLSSVAGPSLCF